MSQTVHNSEKTAGAVFLQTGSEITEKEQLLCNTIMIQFVILHLCHFTNQAQGDCRSLNYSNFTQKLILSILFNTITKHCGFLTKNTKC